MGQLGITGAVNDGRDATASEVPAVRGHAEAGQLGREPEIAIRGQHRLRQRALRVTHGGGQRLLRILHNHAHAGQRRNGLFRNCPDFSGRFCRVLARNEAAVDEDGAAIRHHVRFHAALDQVYRGRRGLEVGMRALGQLWLEFLAQRNDDVANALNGIGALPGQRTMRGTPGDGNPDAGRPLLTNGHPTHRLLTDDHAERVEACSFNDMDSAVTGGFLIGHFRHGQLPTQGNPRACQRNGAHHLRGYARLVITRPAAIDPPIGDLAAERRVLPGRFITDGNHVKMGIECELRTVRIPPGCHQIRLPGSVREFLDGKARTIKRHTACPRRLHHVARRIHGWHANERLQERDGLVSINGGQYGLCVGITKSDRLVLCHAVLS